MRKSLSIIFAILFLAIGATNARADTYRLDFTGPSPFTATFNATAGQVTSGVTVVYEGTTYILTAFTEGAGTGDSGCPDTGATAGIAQYLMLTGTSIPGCSGVLPGSVVADTADGRLFVFGILEGTSCGVGCPVSNLSFYDTLLAPNSTAASADFSGATLVSTPEPSTGIFMLCGLGLLVLTMRNRTASGLGMDTGRHHALSLPVPH